MLLDRRRPPRVRPRPPSRAPARSRAHRRAVAGTAALLVVVFAVGYPPAAASATEHGYSHTRTAFERHAAHAVLHVLNTERRQHGLPALLMSTALLRSARRHDVAMSRAGRMAHRLPGERPFTGRIAHAGYAWRSAGENIGWNALVSRRGAVQLERVMYREKPPNDEHRHNILDTHFRNVGVDVYVDRAHHKLWLTTDFGSR